MLQPTKKKQGNTFIKYSNYAIQMFFQILAFVLIGKYLDYKFENQKLYITAVLSLSGVVLSLFILYRKISNENENEN